MLFSQSFYQFYKKKKKKNECNFGECVPDFMFQEAFLTTYRTLLTPMELINKLIYRYNKFILMSDIRQRAARNAFALLVRVVDDMWYKSIYLLSIFPILTQTSFQFLSQTFKSFNALVFNSIYVLFD
jgi:hypothetical protein